MCDASAVVITFRYVAILSGYNLDEGVSLGLAGISHDTGFPCAKSRTDLNSTGTLVKNCSLEGQCVRRKGGRATTSQKKRAAYELEYVEPLVV